MRARHIGDLFRRRRHGLLHTEPCEVRLAAPLVKPLVRDQVSLPLRCNENGVAHKLICHANVKRIARLEVNVLLLPQTTLSPKGAAEAPGAD